MSKCGKIVSEPVTLTFIFQTIVGILAISGFAIILIVKKKMVSS
jgi:hypothetical protein